MVVSTGKVTFEEYLTYRDGLDTRYELVAGELIPMSLGSGEHGSIIRFLDRQFEKSIEALDYPWLSLSTLVGVQSPRGNRCDTSRIPDITVISAAQWETMRHREAVIRLNDPPPLLVVEVVSESTKSEDYGAKRTEYRLLGIREYWVVDPLQEIITIYELKAESYRETDYRGDTIIQSALLPNFKFTATQVLNARK